MASMVLATGAFLAGCNQKNTPASGEAPKADAIAAVADSASGNPPATFHTGKRKNEGLSSNGRYVIQVSVFKLKGQADAYARKLEAEGFSAYVSEVESPTSDLPGDYYRVRIGGFDTREAATEYARQNLAPKGFDYWVDARVHDRTGASPGAYKAPVVVPSRPANRPAPGTPTPGVYHSPVTTTPKTQPAAPVVTPSPIPLPPREFEATEPAPAPAPAPPAPTPGDSMRSPFDESPAESSFDSPAPLPAYKSDTSGMRTRRVLPTW